MNVCDTGTKTVLIHGNLYIFDNQEKELRICIETDTGICMYDIYTGRVFSVNPKSTLYTDVTALYCLKKI